MEKTLFFTERAIKMDMQNTVKSPATISGIALHTGARATVNILPAPENTGIVFRRIDMPGRPEVRAVVENVIDVRRATTIANRQTGAFVVLVEHIMAALHASRIDNAVIEMNGPEPPIADGSAGPYFDIIQEAGIQEQTAPAEYWTATQPIVFEDGHAILALLPSDELKITFTVEYGATPLDTQFFSTPVTTETFSKELSRARTFVIYRELEQVIAAGLAKGGSLDNAIIMHNGAIVCKEGMRYKNELVRHKMMDMVGDLYLIGKRVKANICSVKSGHPTHVKLVGMMRAQELAAKQAKQ